MNWINVKDKTPKDDYPYHEPTPDVLVNYCWGMKVARQFQCGIWVDDKFEDVLGVTHWMRLPEKPNEK